jgi:hypothetical protein
MCGYYTNSHTDTAPTSTHNAPDSKRVCEPQLREQHVEAPLSAPTHQTQCERQLGATVRGDARAAHLCLHLHRWHIHGIDTEVNSPANPTLEPDEKAGQRPEYRMSTQFHWSGREMWGLQGQPALAVRNVARLAASFVNFALSNSEETWSQARPV